MDELRDKIADRIKAAIYCSKISTYNVVIIGYKYSDEILSLIKDSGGKSPEEVKSIPPLRKVRWGWCVKPNTNCQGPDCEGCEFLRV